MMSEARSLRGGGICMQIPRCAESSVHFSDDRTSKPRRPLDDRLAHDSARRAGSRLRPRESNWTVGADLPELRSLVCRNAVIVVNGASSSGKIAVEPQGLLPRPFLAFGVDTLVASLPPASSTHTPGIVFGSDGLGGSRRTFSPAGAGVVPGTGAMRDDVGSSSTRYSSAGANQRTGCAQPSAV